MSQEETPLSEEQATWVREHFQSANKYLAEKGMLSDTIVTKESRYLIPTLAVWKFKLQSGQGVWVINGKVPTDHVSTKVAKTAREATRHFNMQWQLKAENILANESSARDKTQADMAKYLIQSAESVYAVTQEDRLWGES
ncbi:DUF4826 domain-containing protein [Aliidiomarina minuta]|uniref:DUF4826 domain-containing protein n=1 Tax=Aliidiomarina minuta TaxID=880057 RepID=A0A432W6H1_9GAMM|nr:DUF4826 family protein [Aliidiomarina minuta]RUO25673.1 DUF4826 domain-containing protein [Aliidiomarina minuta]